MSNKTKNQQLNTRFNWVKISKKIVLCLAIVISIVSLTDRKKIFLSDQSNNHIIKKWSSFYDYTLDNDVDILLIGNSHITTGVDPYVLSNATNTTSYILANSGVNIVDAWFHLNEALKIKKPNLVVLETYCINNSEKPIGNAVIPYFQSFDAHKNTLLKIQNMPLIFKSDYWLSAWSSTIRNHSFIFNQFETIKHNIATDISSSEEPTSLNLGRFARFDTGLDSNTLKKYETNGAPVNFENSMLSEYSTQYLHKIIKTCNDNNIQFMLLTIPMYHKHIKNYTIWKKKLKAELNQYSTLKWLDLQENYDTLVYTPEMFENTYAENQHLSNLGMSVSAYKLADFVISNFSNHLPNRSTDENWIANFNQTPHFIYNQKYNKNMSNCSLICQNELINQYKIEELLVEKSEQSNLLILKIKKEKNINLPKKLEIKLAIISGNEKYEVVVPMKSDVNIFPNKNAVYFCNINNKITVNKLLNIE